MAKYIGCLFNVLVAPPYVIERYLIVRQMHTYTCTKHSRIHNASQYFVCIEICVLLGYWCWYCEYEVVKQVKDLSYVILQTKEKKVSSKYKREIDFCVFVSSKFDHQDEFISHFSFIVLFSFQFFQFERLISWLMQKLTLSKYA